MAVIAPTRIQHGANGQDVFEWAGLQNGDTGGWLVIAGKNDKSVHAYGTWGAGGNVRMEGSLETGTPSNPATLHDPSVTALNLTTSVSTNAILEHLHQIRPNVTAGDGTTSLTVRVAVYAR